ncbi:UDP-glucose/GDP-mannose dehydrogenase family protein [Sinirhodobacter sp. WL0062]|uniref:UDP-glucose 6-dehydrogenase n=1 Tax=Rhodobacter flavimaris TaxID=2907145 RepID=A0ABS8YTG4_9RHOB|nr:UDP-glucose/GDP-mannose dehydrogenase family protein [Sinirhodobacter sp. WL0062]MCE5972565.1 UDP-glucose/GDP-mannose dehydrogenase family protein [Sinirhodobacter sp. WL0062]
MIRNDAAIKRRKAVEFEPWLTAPKPSISVVGLGYVGAVTCGCLSELGHRIVGVDIDPEKVTSIENGQSPMHENGLETLLKRGVSARRIEATTDLGAAVAESDVTFVSVGTPTAHDGSCDLSGLVAVAKAIGTALRKKLGFHIVVLRCSVPPGTTQGVMAQRIAKWSGKSLGTDFGLAFVPEFLREGVAIADFNAPPKTVIGASDARTREVVSRIFRPIDNCPIFTEIETAEMVKYVDNVWHATKVSFANEVGRLAKSMQIDGRAVMDIFCRDTKLNLSPYYLKPGFAYGGSCLPKEVRAFAHLAAQQGVELPLVNSLAKSNEAQIDAAMSLIRASGAHRVGILGLAFKPGTDDLRESPAVEIVTRLLDCGMDIVAHDHCLSPKPCAIAAKPARPKRPRVGLSDELDARLDGMLLADPAEVVKSCDIVFVTHDLPRYRDLLGDTRKLVIDVARLMDKTSRPHSYEGIGW